MIDGHEEHVLNPGHERTALLTELGELFDPDKVACDPFVKSSSDMTAVVMAGHRVASDCATLFPDDESEPDFASILEHHHEVVVVNFGSQIRPVTWHVEERCHDGLPLFRHTVPMPARGTEPVAPTDPLVAERDNFARFLLRDTDFSSGTSQDIGSRMFNESSQTRPE